jgi:hypothetical protein
VLALVGVLAVLISASAPSWNDGIGLELALDLLIFKIIAQKQNGQMKNWHLHQSKTFG